MNFAKPKEFIPSTVCSLQGCVNRAIEKSVNQLFKMLILTSKIPTNLPNVPFTPACEKFKDKKERFNVLSYSSIFQSGPNYTWCRKSMTEKAYGRSKA